MTREALEADLKIYQDQLARLEGDINEAKARVTQMIANANATKGVTQYLEMTLAKLNAPVNDLSKLEVGVETVDDAAADTSPQE